MIARRPPATGRELRRSEAVPWRPGTRPARTAGVLAAAAALLAACTTVTDGTPSPAGAGPPPGLERFYAQQIAWGPCADFATDARDRRRYANPRLECGRIEAPLDYGHPQGRTVSLAVLRQRASGQRIGSLVVNPGGPGASGNQLAATLAPQLALGPVGQRFDVVGFDPRGVGASTPTLDCLDDAGWAAERADLDVDPSPAGVAQTEKENRDYADGCIRRSGGAEVLANAGTRDVVKDLDMLRAVLGDDKLTFLGFSYGTRIGSTYAEAFPRNVRALVLDGALDPTESTADRTVAQNEGFQHAFDAFAADCASAGGCPLGTDPAGATAAFQALSRPLIDAPLRVGDRELSYTDAVTGVVVALYADALWPRLRQALTGLQRGDGAGLLALADKYYGRGSDGHYDDSLEAFVAIGCVDEERVTDRARQREIDERAKRAAPFRDPGRGAVGALDPCAFWPAPPTLVPHAPKAVGLPPTLVVSTTGDPATPYRAGVDLAHGLGATLVTFEGTRHTVAFQGNRCVDQVVTAYLVDLTVPRSDPTCAT